MPHLTENATKFQLDQLTLTPLRVRNKSYTKTDRHTHTDGLSKTTFFDVSKVLLYILKAVLTKVEF